MGLLTPAQRLVLECALEATFIPISPCGTRSCVLDFLVPTEHLSLSVIPSFLPALTTGNKGLHVILYIDGSRAIRKLDFPCGSGSDFRMYVCVMRLGLNREVRLQFLFNSLNGVSLNGSIERDPLCSRGTP